MKAMAMLLRPLPLLAAAWLICACSGQAADSGAPSGKHDARPTRITEESVQIRLIAGGRAFRATLEDNAATRDFVTLLPLELTLSDYNRTEKIADLPKRLSTEGSPDGIDPQIGDIAYYAPWGNLAIFYRDFGYSKGLVRLGKIADSLAALAHQEAIPVRIEQVANKGE